RTRRRNNPDVKAIVGLGNPGSQYKGTRHNVGFEVVDLLARRASAGFESAPAEALIAKWRRPDDSILLVKPLTFMNLSGQAVGELARYFKIDVADLIVVVDEVHLPLGKLRARMRGSAGGHNGLKSVIAHLGDDFSRLRLGVGRPGGPGRAGRPRARGSRAREVRPGRSGGGRAHDYARGRCRRHIHHLRDRRGDE